MVALIIFTICIFSFCLAGVVFCNKKFEDTLPLAFTTIVIILLGFGVVGILKSGVIILLIGFAVLLGTSIVKIFKSSNSKEICQNFFTPCFVVFSILLVYFVYTLYGKLYDGFDEFSHWGDVVKAMTVYDKFSTDPEMNSLFPTYPPGMSLLLYFVTKIDILVSGKEYTEYLSIIGSCMFTVSFIIPAFRFIKHKPLDYISALIIIIGMPQFLFFSAYTYVFIDAFLGIVFGATMLQILFVEDKDWIYDLTVCSSAFVLVLAKDAGILFSVMIVIAYIVDRIVIYDKKCDKLYFNIIKMILMPIFAIAVPKLLWNYCINRDGAKKVFPSQYNISDYIGVVTGKIDSYRRESYDNFNTAIFNSDILDEYTGVRVSYFVLAVILSVAVTTFIILLIKYGKVKRSTGLVVLVVSSLSMFIYMWGMRITYMYNFSEYDAIILTSFCRYMNIGFVGIWTAIFIALFYAVYEKKNMRYVNVILLLVVVALTNPIKFEYKVLTRQLVNEAEDYRKDIDSFAEKIKECVDKNDRIYYVSQEASDYNFYTMHTSARPCKILNWHGWSLGGPFYEKDYFSVQKSSEDFINELALNYDYLAIQNINESFVDSYSDLFYSSDEIKAESIYKVTFDDKEQRYMLEFWK